MAQRSPELLRGNNYYDGHDGYENGANGGRGKRAMSMSASSSSGLSSVDSEMRDAAVEGDTMDLS